MTSRHTNPAIYAGLAGAAAWAAPTCASALTVLGTDVPISEPALSFIAGCVAGAVVASGTSLAINHAINSRREREAAEQALAAHARSAKAARNRDAVKRLEEREAYLAARAAQEKGAAHVAYPEPAGQQRQQQARPQQARPQAAPQGSLQQQMAQRAAAQQAAQRAAQQGAHMTPAQRAQAAAQHHNVNTPAERAQQDPAERAARAAEAAREAAIAEAQLKVRAAQAKAEQARKAAEQAQNAAAHQADVYAARQAAAFAAQQAAYVAQGMHVPGMQGGLDQRVPAVSARTQKAAPVERPEQHHEEPQHHEGPRGAEAGRPRHAARSTVRADATGTWDKTGDIRVQAAPTAPRAKAQKQGPAQAAPQQGKPRYTVAAHYGSASTDPGVSAAWEAWQTAGGGNGANADYLDVAEEYVNRITLKDRMAQRAKGVAGVLSERLGASKMEGLPVIARADGSVGDVGESWWNDAMGDDVRAVADGVTGLRGVEESMLDNSAVLFTAQTREQAQAAKGRWQAQQRPQQGEAQQRPQQARPQQARAAQPAQQTGEVAYTPRTDRAAIAGRLADPKVVFPDQTHHWSDEQQDLWNVALNALDERTKEQVAMAAAGSASASFTTDFSTLDEPDHMEPATQFMSFKPQGGKPEVVDAESYVDMLLDQELAKSDSEAVRKLAQHEAHEYFRVVDGGTADIAPKPAPTPHHVAL